MTAPSLQDQQEVSAYGRSLLLEDGDLVLENGRLREVAGADNLEQGLLLRIRTIWASDRLSAAYGLDVTDAFTVGLTRALTKEVLRLNLIRTVAGDPRVASVERVLFDDDPEYGAAHPEAAGPGSDRRVAVAEITVTPVAGGPASSASAISMASLAAAMPRGSRGPGSLTLLVDVRW
ncbi:hypothetical protein [Arthrobacter sp. H41]|uniref:hypothetical protein n=1 Tax=Arthrobacter sp. H41 TaxID=1312978 RepID=UPI00047C0272|nr:hypothetical protein [Arthrobacter sp. H41]